MQVSDHSGKHTVRKGEDGMPQLSAVDDRFPWQYRLTVMLEKLQHV